MKQVDTLNSINSDDIANSMNSINEISPIYPINPIMKADYPDPDVIRVKLIADFEDMRDLLYFEVREGECWKRIGDGHQLKFGLDHFTGARFGLNVFSSVESGGFAKFSNFEYELLLDVL